MAIYGIYSLWVWSLGLVSGFGRQKRCAYEAFVNDTKTDAVYEFYSKPKIAPMLGGEPFIAKCIEGKNTDLDIPELASVKPSPNPAEIIASILKVCGVTIDLERSIGLLWSKRLCQCGERDQEIEEES